MRKDRYVNLDPVFTEKTMNHFNRWRQERARKAREKDYTYVVPNVKPDLTYLHHNRTEPALTWIGHSTFLIQHSGLNIVTDPVWSTQLALHKRMAPPGVAIEDMPPVDVVLVSHSHYDHLSVSSLRRLSGSKTILVPGGLKSKLQFKGFMKVKELEWWESVTIRGLKFTFVPSQHWTRRNPWDMNKSHWGGWVIEPTAAHAAAVASQPAVDVPEEPQVGSYDDRPVVPSSPVIYFAGDSGYFRGFAEIGRRFKIDVALMPIGAYDPEWFMGPQHVSPEESLQAFLDTKAGWFVPMHYGSFKLADDTPREALDRLEAGRGKLNIPSSKLVILPHGETWKMNGSHEG
ncbi:MBL fold metallo-hydrolase [Paenibacillus sambharensis]|uniref:MBL fold metallo-hydrolase n=1 Tax=Paenibacillus sambharensis TaxID=1803190 RepID=A0A2W1LUN9_9BACL|nr:MBL fold metallo-hydrolase [Paenibacillus sambharensis]PZD95501.1 MBL fold metallo-hydrolase [Paenibacillus sambharensis]